MRKNKDTVKTRNSSIAKYLFTRIGIVILISIILTDILSAVQIRNEVEEYYLNKGYLLTDHACDILTIKIDEHTRILGGTLEDMDFDETCSFLQSLCQYYTDIVSISLIYLEKETPDTAIRIFEVNSEEYNTDECDYVLRDFEKPVVEGETKYVRETVDPENLKIVTYEFALVDQVIDKEKAVAIMRFDFDTEGTRKDEFEKIIPNTIILLFLIIAVQLVLMFLLRNVILKPLLSIQNHMKKLVREDNISQEPLELAGKGEILEMTKDYNQMVASLGEYVANLEKMNYEKHAIARELEIASGIQSGMLKPDFYSDEDIVINAFMKTCVEMGGDFYDYFPIDDHRFCFAVGDVSGKGISAAIFMAFSMITLRYNAKRFDSPKEIMAQANRELCASNPRQMFVTIFLCIYDKDKNSLTFTNGGHNIPYLVTDHVVSLRGANGMLVGLFDNAEYEEMTIPVKEGDILYIYTDGVNEAFNEKDEQYSNIRLERNLNEFNRDNSNLNEYIFSTIEEFRGNCPQADDITMLSVLFGKDISK